MTTIEGLPLVWLIMLCAAATLATRVGGHLILARFDRIHHRVEAALNAVPAAVLTALIAPALISNGPAEALAMLIAGVAGLRLSAIGTIAVGLLVLVMLRVLLPDSW